MVKIKTIYLLLLLAVFTSCDREEVLDIKPYGKDIPTSVEDFRLLLDQRISFAETSVGVTKLYEVDLLMSDDIKVPDGTVSSYIPYTGYVRYKDALTWEENFGLLDEDDNEWSNLYGHVQLNNTVITQLTSGNISGDEQIKQQLIAEAKVHRAIAYFSLVNLYSKQYQAATAASDLGVPIRLGTEMNGETPRESVQKVYDLILQDLKDAQESNALPESVPDYSWRPSMAALYAVLAKVHLQMGNYSKALEASDNCLNIYNTLIDLNTIYSLPINYNNEELIMLKTNTLNVGATVFISDELTNMYDFNDLRPSNRYNLDWATGNYTFNRIIYNGSSYVGPSVGEMYLIRAECNARIGDYTLAIDDLNTLRVKRHGASSYVNLTTTELPDAEQTLAFVLAERRRELAGQGVRLFDLKRYNALHNAGIDIERSIDGKTTLLEANSNRWIVPIARKTMSLAPEIKQSPR